MADQRRRLEKVLRGCAEASVPDSTDLWPAVRERVPGARAGVEPAAGRAGTGSRQRSLVPGFVPNTPLGWALAVVSVLILCVGIYVAIEPARELFRQGLPGAVGPGSEKVDKTPGISHEDRKSGLLTPIGETRTADGAKVTLEWAYADEKFVAVGLEVPKLGGVREPQGSGSGPDPPLLMPSLWDDSVGDESELPPYMKITDASGQDFDSVGGGTLLGPQRTGADGAFDAPKGIEPGRGHRFRLEVPLVEEPRVGAKVSGRSEPGPFVFDFEIPVRPAPTIELNQRVEAEGVTLTLKRVVDSPLLPQAVVCFETPDGEYRWMPWVKDDGSYPQVVSNPQELGDGCWSLMMSAPVKGRSSVTVETLESVPGSSSDPDEPLEPKVIRGPWTFEFDAPER